MSSTDISYLQSNRGVLQISGLNTLNLTLFEYTLPGITVGSIDVPNPHGITPEVGDQLNWEELNVVFHINNDMSNWLEVFDWCVGSAAPEGYEQYDDANLKRDCTLIIFDAQNNPVLSFLFEDCKPVALEGINFTEEDSESVTKRAALTMRYSNFSKRTV